MDMFLLGFAGSFAATALIPLGFKVWDWLKRVDVVEED